MFKRPTEGLISLSALNDYACYTASAEVQVCKQASPLRRGRGAQQCVAAAKQQQHNAKQGKLTAAAASR
eukprot:11218761-Lingulodinium_polyedra.AAC.1